MEVLLSTLAPPAYQLEGAWGSCAGAASGEVGVEGLGF